MKTTRTFKRIVETKKRIVENRGWSWSSKTYSTLQMYFKWLTTGEMRKDEWEMKWVSTVARQYRVELYSSVLRDWYKIADEEWFMFSSRVSWWKYIKENKSLLNFSYEWRTVEFIGCDDPEKVKGPRRYSLYCNEANNISYRVFMQMLMRTSWLCVIDFNPDDDEVWINTEIEQKRATLIGDVDLIVSTFRDNAFLPKAAVDEILNFRITDPEMWKVYGNGEYWKIQGAIFEKGTNWDVIWDIPDSAEFKWYGQDFWFTNDPTTLIGVYKYDKDTIVLDEVFRETNLVNTYEDEDLKQQSIQGYYEMHNVDPSSPIWADSSEPKSIEEIYHKGYNIEGVKKWEWSVVAWIKFMKKFKILITARSFNLINEFKKYKWATDKNWKVLKDKKGRPIPEDKYNHWIDGGRYWITHIFDAWENVENIEISIL